MAKPRVMGQRTPGASAMIGLRRGLSGSQAPVPEPSGGAPGSRTSCGLLDSLPPGPGSGISSSSSPPNLVEGEEQQPAPKALELPARCVWAKEVALRSPRAGSREVGEPAPPIEALDPRGAREAPVRAKSQDRGGRRIERTVQHPKLTLRRRNGSAPYK